MDMIPPAWKIAVLLSFGALLHSGLSGQSPQDWTLLDAPGRLLKADMSQTDESGWTHYYNSKQNQLILSIYKNGQSIGELDEMLSISSGLLNNYGKGANDLSGADYVQNAFWLTFNRYWRIQDARPVTRPVRVRFYFNQQDIKDLERGLQPSGYSLDSLGAIQFYALEGGSLHPFAIRTRSGASTVKRFSTGKTASVGKWGGFMYAEFQLEDLASSGSGGFFIPLEGQKFSISGRITSPAGDPIEDVYVRSQVEGASVRTTAEGEFTVANLQGGRSYDITPFSQDRPSRMVTVLDLIALSQYFNLKGKWKTPWQQLAADIDQSGSVDEKDLAILQKIVLGEPQKLPLETSWLFLPASFNLPDISDRRMPRLPAGSLKVETLASNLKGADFKAFKIGNIWREQDFPNEPPSILDPSFALSDQLSCGGGELIRYDLLVNDFVGIRGFQFTLQWDPKVMHYEGVEGFNLPHMDLADFGASQKAQGKLSVAWFTPDRPNTIKLPDGARVFTLLFRAIGGPASRTSIRFIEDPAAIQVLRDNLSAANVFFTMGSLEIQGSSAMSIAETIVWPVSCSGVQDGSISVVVQGGMPPYRYEWSNGASTATIQDLKPGKYKVTIYDASPCPITTDSLEITEPVGMVLHSHNIRQISCPGMADGAISFKVTGGQPPYRYAWSNGAITPWIGQLEEGSYKVTVSDQRGCQIIDEFAIEARKDIFLNHSIAPASGQTTRDGEIVLRELTGSNGPLVFEWSNGQKGPKLGQLAPGTYEVSVNDAGGCAYSFQFEVPEGSAPAALGATIPREMLPAAAFFPVTIQSPEAQTVYVKLYDQKSRLLAQQVIDAPKGTTRQYLQAPAKEGGYLIQVLPQHGQLVSLRFRVR